MPSSSSRKLKPKHLSTKRRKVPEFDSAMLRAHAGRTPDIKEAVAVGADSPAAVETMDRLCKDMGLELVDVTPTVRKYRKSSSAQRVRKRPDAPPCESFYSVSSSIGPLTNDVPRSAGGVIRTVAGPLTNDDTADDEDVTDEEKWADAGTP